MVRFIAMACFVRRAGGSFAIRPMTTCGCRGICRTWKTRWCTRISSAPCTSTSKPTAGCAVFFDIERPEFRDLSVSWQPHPYVRWASNGFGLAFAGHRLEAYLRLPEGWTTTPTGLPTDQFMWTTFAREPWCRIRALQWPISLHFPAPDRRNWTDEQRVDELARWADIIGRPNGREHVHRAMLRTFGDILLRQNLATVQQHAALSAPLEREELLRARAEVERDAAQTLLAKARAGWDAEQTLRAKAEAARTKAEADRNAEQTLRARTEAERDAERARAQAERSAEQALRARAEGERDAIRESTFWRLTAP